MKRSAPTPGSTTRPGKISRPSDNLPLLAPIRRQFASYPSGKQSLLTSFSNLSDQTKNTFKAALRAVRSHKNRPLILRTATRVFPDLRKWMKTCIPHTGLPSHTDIDSLIALLKLKTEANVGEKLFETIAPFVNAALRDHVAVDIMRQVNLMGPFPWETRAPASDLHNGKSLYSAIRPFVMQYPGRRDAFMQALVEVSAETKAAFKIVRRAFHQSDNRHVVINAVRDSLVSVITWAKQELSDDAMPDTEAIAALADDISSKIQPTVTRAFVQAAKAFVIAALADQKLVQVLRQMRSVHTAADAPADSAGKRSVPTEKAHGKLGLYALIKPFFQHYPSGKNGLFNDLKGASDETVVAFKKMRRVLRNSDNTDAVIASMKSMLPAFWLWMIGSLGDEGVPSGGSIHQLVGILKTMLPAEDTSFNALFASFLHTALSDTTIIGILRKIRSINVFSTSADTDVNMVAPRDRQVPAKSSNEDKRGLIAGVRPYFEHYPNGKEALFKDLSEASVETKKAFRKVKNALKVSDNRAEVVQTVKDIFLVLHPWLKSNLPDAAMPSAASITQLISDVLMRTTALNEWRRGHVVSFLEAILSDNKILVVLRNIRDIVLPEETVRAQSSTDGKRNGNKGLFFGIRPFFSQYPTGKAGLFKSLELVSKDTKVSFRKLRRSAKMNQNRDIINEAAKAAFQILRTWMNEDLKDGSMPSAESVNHLTRDIGNKIRSVIAEEIAGHAEVFIRAALNDTVAIDILRNIRQMGPFPWNDGMEVERSATREVAGPNTMGTGGKGLFAPIKPYLSQYPSGRQGFFNDLKNVSEESKVEFKKVKKSLRNAENKNEIFTAGEKCIPIVRKWMRIDLGKDEVASQESITKLIDDISTHLKAMTTDILLQRLAAFLGVALQDKSVIRIIRRVRKGGLLRGNNQRLARCETNRQLSKGSGIHHRAKRNVTPIVGSRFKGTSQQNDNLFLEFYGNDKINEEGKTFRECRFVWEDILPDMDAPPAPLKPGERGPKVKFLHKVLTDLGYMDATMYTPRVGMYGPKTRKAVHKFQIDNGVTGAENGVYDSSTAERLATMVKARGSGATETPVLNES